MQHNKLFGNRVRIYSFLLTVLVIWIHAVQPSVIYPEGSPFSDLWITAQRMLGTNLGQIAVPGFFVISGYLFFRGMGEQVCGGLSSGGYGVLPESVKAENAAGREDHTLFHFFIRKWKSRARSLLIPYLVWNLIYYLIYLAAGRADLSLKTAFESIFLYRFNPVFWYLKQLILLTLLTPLVWLLVQNRKAAPPALILLFLLGVFYDLLPFHIVNEDAFLYYALGAAAALHLKGAVETDPPAAAVQAEISAGDKEKRRLPAGGGSKSETSAEDREAGAPSGKESVNNDTKKSTCHTEKSWLGCFVATFFLYILLQVLGSRASLFGLMHPTVAASIGCRIFGLISLWALLRVLRAGRFTPAYMEYNFFTYATHYLVLRAVQHAAAFAGESALISLTLYILMPAICIAVSVCTGRFLQRHAPRLFSLLVGGRT